MKPGIVKITDHLGRVNIQFTYDVDHKLSSFNTYNDSNSTLFGKGKMSIKVVKTLPPYIEENKITGWIDYYWNWYKGTGHEMLTPVYTIKPPIEKSSVKKIKRRRLVPVSQLTLDGKLVKDFPSIGVAESETGIFAASIRRTIKGIGTNAGGYLWAWNTGSAA